MWIINLQKSQAVWVSYLVSGSTREDNRKAQHRARPNVVAEFGPVGGKSLNNSISDMARSLALRGRCEPASSRCFHHIWSSSPEILAETLVLGNVVTGMALRSIYSMCYISGFTGSLWPGSPTWSDLGLGPERLGVYQQGKCTCLYQRGLCDRCPSVAAPPRFLFPYDLL